MSESELKVKVVYLSGTPDEINKTLVLLIKTPEEKPVKRGPEPSRPHVGRKRAQGKKTLWACDGEA